MAAIPIGVKQHDVIEIAETGSRKTAALVLPMLNYISKLPSITEKYAEDGPCAVVMASTRELAQQIEVETNKFAHSLGISIVSIVGGQSIQEQSKQVRQGCEVVIATPGRLIDCLERRYVVLNRCCSNQAVEPLLSECTQAYFALVLDHAPMKSSNSIAIFVKLS